MRLLITGASGFVGRHLFFSALKAGHDTRAVLRRPEAGFEDSAIVPDPAAHEDWRALLAGREGLVHCAALVHRPMAVQQAQREDYARINTALPLRLAEEAAAAGLRHFVFISTIGVHGPTSDGGAPFSEASPIRPDSPYAETKARAEEGLQEIARRTGLALSIIRPVLVYGPGAKGNFATLLRLVRSGLPLPLAGIRNRRAFVARANLSSLILHRLAAAPSGIETLIAADAERVSTADFIRALAAALGRKPALFPVPPGLLRLLLTAGGRKAMAHSLLGSLDVDNGAARRLGWRPPLSLADGLAEAVRAGAR